MSDFEDWLTKDPRRAAAGVRIVMRIANLKGELERSDDDRKGLLFAVVTEDGHEVQRGRGGELVLDVGDKPRLWEWESASRLAGEWNATLQGERSPAAPTHWREHYSRQVVRLEQRLAKAT